MAASREKIVSFVVAGVLTTAPAAADTILFSNLGPGDTFNVESSSFFGFDAGHSILAGAAEPQRDVFRFDNGAWQTGIRRFEMALRVTGDVTSTPVPEPATLGLVGLGVAGLLRYRRMK